MVFTLFSFQKFSIIIPSILKNKFFFDIFKKLNREKCRYIFLWVQQKSNRIEALINCIILAQTKSDMLPYFVNLYVCKSPAIKNQFLFEFFLILGNLKD